MKLNPNEKNTFDILWQLIRFSDLKITATSLKKVFLQQQDGTTLAGLSDILHEFSVPNLATRISPDQLFDIPLPAIVHFDIGGGTYATIKKIENDVIEWYHDTDGIHKEPIRDFIHKWNGVTLLVEPNEESGELNYRASRNNEIIEKFRLPFVSVGLLIIVSLFLQVIFTKINLSEYWQLYGLLFTKGVGLIISTMLVWHGIDSNNTFLKSVCQINNKTNCNNILNSKAAKVFDWLTWSEVGLFYFAGGFIALLFTNLDAFFILQLFGFLVVPYTLWSIYYQAFVAKEWCPLCVGVQILIWVEFFIFLSLPVESHFVSIDTLSFKWQSITIAFIMTPILWAFVKNPIKKSFQSNSLYVELQKLKFNPDYLNSLMTKELFLPPIFEGMKVISLGEDLAETVLTLVINPLCGSCRETYLTAKKIVETKNDLQVRIILAGSLESDDLGGQVARKILSQETDERVKFVLNEWFKDSSKNVKQWIIKTKIQEETLEGEHQMRMHLRWLELAGISEAPVTFIDNHELPKIYLTEDILKLLRIYSKEGFANQK